METAWWERAADNQPYFFLSYAHMPRWEQGGGDPDHWVHVLYKDLCENIMHLTDLPAGAPAGFMDRELRSGEGWSEKLAENLATCRVFIPLFSPRYFASEMCGRELFAFNQRLVDARTTGLGAIPAIVPVLWTRVDYSQLPESVGHLHIDNSAFGGAHANEGLYRLIKLNRRRDEYQETVLQLAEHIVRVAQDSPLPPGTPRDYDATPSAFKPRGQGTRRIHLTVAAPTRGTLPEHRDVRPYGERAQDWNPYHSEATRPLSAHAAELIRSLDYRVTVSSLDEADASLGAEREAGVEGTPDGDAGPDQPHLLIVDRWVATAEKHCDELKRLDGHAQSWMNVVVPWNHADIQCHSAEGVELCQVLEDLMPRLLDRGRRTPWHRAVDGVPTLKEFTDLLPAVVAHAAGQFLRHAHAHPPSGPHVPRPRLLGPAPPADAQGPHEGGEE